MSAKEDDKAEREAYIRGAKDALEWLRSGDRESRAIGRRFMWRRACSMLVGDILKGEWPRGE